LVSKQEMAHELKLYLNKYEYGGYIVIIKTVRQLELLKIFVKWYTF
jgi:hypothetical protein